MRKDFGRVVIGRERTGSSAPNLKMRKTGRFRLESPDWEEWDYDGPLKIRTNGLYGVKHAYDREIGEKQFTDVLGPIRGYLQKSIGRQWDDVFSELQVILGSGTHPMQHIVGHIMGDVCVNTYVENGKVYAQPYDRSYGRYFVDPRDGTLRREADRPRYRHRKPALDRRYLKDGLWLVRINGIWYLGAYTKNAALASITPLPAREKKVGFLGLTIAPPGWSPTSERDRLWPNVDGWYFVKWRQASKKEIKHGTAHSFQRSKGAADDRRK